MTKPKRVTLRAVTDAWRERIPFDCNGTLTGEAVGGYVYGLGRLPQEYRDLITSQEGHIIYVVHSYATPIAWVLDDGEIVKPPVKYSVTTSKHQGKLY